VPRAKSGTLQVVTVVERLAEAIDSLERDRILVAFNGPG